MTSDWLISWLAPAIVTIAGMAIWHLRMRTLYRTRLSDAGYAPADIAAWTQIETSATNQPSTPNETTGETADKTTGDTQLPVSIIVPARNEAHNLPALLDSLLALTPAPQEIIIVDDHSTDGTGDIARRAGARHAGARHAGVRVVEPPALPAGWNGKPWACRTGAKAAKGAYLLFTDADTVHSPDSLGHALAQLHKRRAALLSVVPTHVIRSAWERLQGIFALLLLLACRAGAAPPKSTARPDGRRSTGERRFSIGQYLLFRRDAYEALGGHDPVRNRIAEDLAFARMIEDAGERFTLLFRPRLMQVRMYPEGFWAFVRGWRRNFREGFTSAGIGGTLEMVAVIGWLLGIPLFFAQALWIDAFTVAGVWMALYLLSAVEIGRRQIDQGAFPLWSGFFYPVFAFVFVMISFLAVIDRVRQTPVMWRGRTAMPGGEAQR